MDIPILEEIMEHLPVGVARITIDAKGTGRCEYLSPYARSLAGLKTSDGRPDMGCLLGLFPNWERESLGKRLNDAFDCGHAFSWEGEIVTPAGIRFVRISACCSADTASGRRCIDGTIEDITGKRHELERSQNMIKKVRELAGAFEEFRELYDGEPQSARRPDLDILSERERMVAELILEGFTNKQISDKLFISESTVKKHTNSIFRKIEIHGRNDLFLLETQ